MKKRPELDRGDFYSQFHNLDHHHDSSNYSAPEWYDIIDEDGKVKHPSHWKRDEDHDHRVKLSEHHK